MAGKIKIGKEHIARALLLVALPFLLGAVVLPHTQELTGESVSTPFTIQQSYLQTETYEFAHTYFVAQNPSELSTLFPLANYLHFYPLISYNSMSLCFRDTGSYITTPDNATKNVSVDWEVSLNNATTLYIPEGMTNCTSVAADSSYSLRWLVYLPKSVIQENDPAKTTFTPKVSVYTKSVVDYGILQGIILVPVFYLFVFYPIAGIIRKIRDGILEQ